MLFVLCIVCRIYGEKILVYDYIVLLFVYKKFWIGVNWIVEYGEVMEDYKICILLRNFIR